MNIWRQTDDMWTLYLLVTSRGAYKLRAYHIYGRVSLCVYPSIHLYDALN